MKKTLFTFIPGLLRKHTKHFWGVGRITEWKNAGLLIKNWNLFSYCFFQLFKSCSLVFFFLIEISKPQGA
jgi:hypothetical protein